MATQPIPRPPIEPHRPARSRGRRPRRSPELGVWPLEGRELLSAGSGSAGGTWPRPAFATAAETWLGVRVVGVQTLAVAGAGSAGSIAVGVQPSSPPVPPTAGIGPGTVAVGPPPGEAGVFARLVQLFGGHEPAGQAVAAAPKPPAVVAGPIPLTTAAGQGDDSPPPGPGAWLKAGGSLPWKEAGASWHPDRPGSTHQAVDPVTMAKAMVDGKLLLALVDPAKSRIVLQYDGAPVQVFRDHTDGLDHPSAVALEDLTGTGRIDLIVANSGGDNVLIYPGLGGGRFGPELNGGRGIAVGVDPVSVTVADVNGDGLLDILVADKGSDDLALLLGRGRGAAWTLVPGPRLPVGAAPVSTLVQDVYHDGHPDILVSNSGANDVYLLKGTGPGTFDVAAPMVFPVGVDPVQVLVGQFDRYPGIDLVTINKGSNDMTLISNFLSEDRVTQTYKTGIAPDAAIAVDMNGTGLLDLVVANSGSGSFSLFKGGNTGLDLASTFYDPNLPSPTALVPVVIGGGQVEFYAGTSGQESADLLAFALGAGDATGVVTNFPGLDSPSPLNADFADSAAAQVVAQLIPLSDSSLDAIALLVTANRGDRPTQSALDELTGESLLLDLATAPVGQANAAPGAIAGGDGGDGDDGAADEPPAGAGAAIPAGPAGRSPTSWTRFVLGVDEALDGNRRGPLDDPPQALGGLAPEEDGAPVGPDDWLAAANPARGGLIGEFVDEAIGGLSRADEPDPPGEGPGETSRPDRPDAAEDRAVPAAPAADPAEVAATASSATLLALRMILKLSPRRRPDRPTRRRGPVH